MSANSSTESGGGKKQLEYLPASKQPTWTLPQSTEKQSPKRPGYIDEPMPSSSQTTTGDTMSNTPPIGMRSFYDEVNQRNTSEGFWAKMYRLGKYNPFVPLGCLVTVGILANGVWAMRKKDTAKSQRMMRYRIAAQGTTIIALVFGTMFSQYLVSISAPAAAPQAANKSSNTNTVDSRS